MFKHLTEDGGEGDWAQFDFTDLFHFKMRDTAGATSFAISFS